MSNTIPKFEPITETVRQLYPDIWPDLVTESKVDLRLLGSRPAEDWRHELSMAIQSFADSAHKIADALNEGGEKAAYIRANARQFGEPLPLQLVCSIWLAMEKMEAAE